MSSAAQNINYSDPPRYEKLGGKIYALARPALFHSHVACNIRDIFRRYLRGKHCKTFLEPDVFINEDNPIPDVVIVCDKDKIKYNGIYGAPDLIVEVLSPSTGKRDRSYKKNLYEQCGVKEYWLVNPATQEIEVYVLKDGQFILEIVPAIIPDYMLSKLTKVEIEDAPSIFNSPTFPDMEILLSDVFDDE